MKTFRLEIQSSEFPTLSMEFDMASSNMARGYAMMLSKQIASPQYRHFHLWRDILSEDAASIAQWLVAAGEPTITEL